MPEKFLIFDADRSLAAIGTQKDITDLSGFPEIPVTMGITQIANALGINIGQQMDPKVPTLFVKKQSENIHPLFPNVKVPTVVYEYGELAKQYGITGIVIDTISHVFAQDMRILEGMRQSKQLEMQDWGKLERMYLGFFEGLKQLPCFVVVNCHSQYDKDGQTGTFYHAPMVKGVTRDRMREFFDVVMFTKTSSDKKSYTWQTFADPSRAAKDRLAVLEVAMPQNFAVVLDKYRQRGYQPKMLVVGESGTGKTKALTTIK